MSKRDRAEFERARALGGKRTKDRSEKEIPKRKVRKVKALPAVLKSATLHL